ncbi:MAG: transposase [Peptococcaceae bacterium]|nr:transposase [Peptococcaceae bacterium]
MFIAYDIKNGIEYAKLYTSIRDGKNVNKDYTNLGRVLDKERGIYRNREQGVFTYDLATNTYGKAPVDFVPPSMSRKESLILDFGDVYLLDQFIRTNGLYAPIDAIGYGNPDTLKAMICYYALCSLSNTHAHSWWEGSYARILYPKANLSSQRISDFLAAIGDEHSQRDFFQEYFKFLEQSGIDTENILIDSTGLPNSIHFPLTAISNHNGEINNEVRLIYVVQQNTGLPLYFRYCPGNVIDMTTLIRCLEELKAQGINVKFAILDAGYYKSENIQELFEKKISFVTRLKGNLVIYKDLVKEHLSSLESKENLVEYNGRYVYLKCVPIELEGHNAYAYIGLDIERKSSESHNTFRRAKDKNMSTSQVFDTINKQGIFIIVTSRRIAKTKILPLYYTRQQIEQVFDIGKHYADLLPLLVQTVETFRGHLLLTFIVTVIIKKLQDALLKSVYNPISLFLNLRNQKCKVFNDRIVTHEAFKKANDCYKLLKVKCPAVIPYKR